MTLVITPALERALTAHSESGYPEEGAGLLLGHVDGERRRAVQLLAMPNRSPEASRPRRYELDPRELIDAEEEADRRGLDVLGVYHSHPDHPAWPSETDRSLALPWYIYVIVSVERGRAVDRTAWRLADDRSRFEPMAIDVESEGD